MKTLMMNMRVMIMTKTFLKTGTLCFGFFILSNCQNKQPLTAQFIVEKAVEAHGGLTSWNAIESIEFDKKTTLFFEDGSIEKETNQKQHFTLRPRLKGSFRDLNQSGIVGFDYNGESLWEHENDSVWQVTDLGEMMRFENSFYAAHYVICQPFELLDPKSYLSYKGEVDIAGRTCHVIDVSYDGDTEASDRWSYFIDTETYEVLANKVELTDHTSWIDNLTFDRSTPIKFNAHRKSYRLNSEGEKTYLRAEYWYANYKVSFK